MINLMYWTFLKIILLIFLNVYGIACYPQYLDINSSHNTSKMDGDEIYPSWLNGSKQLVFQSNQNGNWDIFQYDMERDTIIQLTDSPFNEQHPVMLENNSKLAFTSDWSGENHIYQLNLNTGTEIPLINREIQGKAATFPVSEYLFYCIGYDKLNRNWGLYRYEFKYNSLKYMLPFSTDFHLPKVSDDGEYILFVTENVNKQIDQLNIINWYGNIELQLSDYNFRDPSWYPGGLKIIFISDMDNKAGEIYTIWKDGSHLERWTHDNLMVKNPVISPDGKFLAVSVLVDEKYDLFVISLEDY